MLHRYRALFLALSVAILLLLAYTAWWSTLAWRVRTALADAPAKAMAEKGVMLDLRDAVVGGFPLTLTVELSGARAQWPSGTVLETGAVTASAFAWAPMDVTLSSTAPVRLNLAGSARHDPMTGSAGRMVVEASLGLNGKPKQVKATFLSVMAGLEGGNSPLKADDLTLTWTAPSQPPTGPTDSQGQTSLVISGLDLPGAVPAPLQQRIDQVALSYEPRGPLPTKPSVEGMTAWRDGGGTLDIRSFRVLWSGMDLRANATLALDRDMQPEGAGTAELSGADALIDVMGARGNIPADRLAVMKQGLKGLTRRSDDGRDVLSVPITLQNRQLSVGPIVVGVMPVVPWN
ncbi:DUF2125 domain-containing protein [Niveispirillum cyanobacteriorum]|uniref:Uncharacterized protein n=1 Tax=Niveispirillum cyanobacteriorum TaxID=1612173 RepID=A0A2K9NDX0_9PROT|nr:DUF2125 domain-containing protein [Niveispirillum cyanobacteriorum]AUN30716.1 hypothetical protein C0V82_11035 [Niveispirillum cyanobacteriorum]GGE52023.1 hypothetical protein GCM10011317_07860 [Niveispirillum cyanobacteriorum]